MHCESCHDWLMEDDSMTCEKCVNGLCDQIDELEKASAKRAEKHIELLEALALAADRGNAICPDSQRDYELQQALADWRRENNKGVLP